MLAVCPDALRLRLASAVSSDEGSAGVSGVSEATAVLRGLPRRFGAVLSTAFASGCTASSVGATVATTSASTGAASFLRACPRRLGGVATASSAASGAAGLSTCAVSALRGRPRRLIAGFSVVAGESGVSSVEPVGVFATATSLLRGRPRRRGAGASASGVLSVVLRVRRTVLVSGARSSDTASVLSATGSGAAFFRLLEAVETAAFVSVLLARRTRVFFSGAATFSTGTSAVTGSLSCALAFAARAALERPRFGVAVVRDLEGPEVVFALK
ncbi:hypothetical protein GMO_13570 [Gluconobacter morbifer G707]|uniref:Uncharacterized protein n=1 Tax=Gluconobacter morbifer G707 TaxID=1088869 RepID=G6XIE7_9PROT|nr:hypothetical protein GMO_13570 [Gluconobacter morbifer G707]